MLMHRHVSVWYVVLALVSRSCRWWGGRCGLCALGEDLGADIPDILGCALDSPLFSALVESEGSVEIFSRLENSSEVEGDLAHVSVVLRCWGW